jgi:hypothetical protein
MIDCVRDWCASLIWHARRTAAPARWLNLDRVHCRQDQALHAAYENAVDRTVAYQTRQSWLLDGYLRPVTVAGETSAEIAEAVHAYRQTLAEG